MALAASSSHRTLVSALQGHNLTLQDSTVDDPKGNNRRASKDAQRLTRMERYGYLQDGKNEFNSTDILCVVADAVHVGSEDWLNIMVYNHTKGKVWICPPQAGFFCKQKPSFLEVKDPQDPRPQKYA